MIYLDKNEPTLKDVPDQRVVSRREKGTYQDVIPRLMGYLMKTVFGPENQRAQVKCTGISITIYHDSEYGGTDADIEVALPISWSITVGPEYDVKTLEGERVVSYIHKGPYQDVGVAHEVIHEYMTREGLSVADVCREVYLNDPNEAPVEELLTKVHSLHGLERSQEYAWTREPSDGLIMKICTRYTISTGPAPNPPPTYYRPITTNLQEAYLSYFRFVIGNVTFHADAILLDYYAITLFQ
ncbi:MAG: hypothetical protein C4B59_06670 [Candidatus Methanogaster sp.]|uniref:Uncharacterized protein n=1 Tax=Candidatus Methanogaster sp. TaxID=3386292 RepID=A0AC61L301_9EURY|nr:MAG: hypothetical protein C4B59_06670 [ANME-2 cluster archaeon]